MRLLLELSSPRYDLTYFAWLVGGLGRNVQCFSVHLGGMPSCMENEKYLGHGVCCVFYE